MNRAKNTKYKIYIEEKLVKATEICPKDHKLLWSSQIKGYRLVIAAF